MKLDATSVLQFGKYDFRFHQNMKKFLSKSTSIKQDLKINVRNCLQENEMIDRAMKYLQMVLSCCFVSPFQIGHSETLTFS